MVYTPINPNPGKEEENAGIPRVLPETALDYNLMMINSAWGKEEIHPDLVEKLSKIDAVYKDEAGKVTGFNSSNLWATLGFYTRDLRLSNLDAPQFKYTVHFLDLAADLLRLEMIEPFLVCLSRVATVLELSQSRGGFLRNRQNTLTTEQIARTGEPGKRSLWTGKEINKQG